jgi:hypothetical protein
MGACARGDPPEPRGRENDAEPWRRKEAQKVGRDGLTDRRWRPAPAHANPRRGGVEEAQPKWAAEWRRGRNRDRTERARREGRGSGSGGGRDWPRGGAGGGGDRDRVEAEAARQARGSRNESPPGWAGGEEEETRGAWACGCFTREVFVLSALLWKFVWAGLDCVGLGRKASGPVRFFYFYKFIKIYYVLSSFSKLYLYRYLKWQYPPNHGMDFHRQTTVGIDTSSKIAKQRTLTS